MIGLLAFEILLVLSTMTVSAHVVNVSGEVPTALDMKDAPIVAVYNSPDKPTGPSENSDSGKLTSHLSQELLGFGESTQRNDEKFQKNTELEIAEKDQKAEDIASRAVLSITNQAEKIEKQNAELEKEIEQEVLRHSAADAAIKARKEGEMTKFEAEESEIDAKILHEEEQIAKDEGEIKAGEKAERDVAELEAEELLTLKAQEKVEEESETDQLKEAEFEMSLNAHDSRLNEKAIEHLDRANAEHHQKKDCVTETDHISQSTSNVLDSNDCPPSFLTHSRRKALHRPN